MKKLFVLATMALLILSVTGFAQAYTVGTLPCATADGCADGHDNLTVWNGSNNSFLLGGTELFGLGSDSAVITDTGNKTTLAPMWLVLAIPNDSGAGTSITANSQSATALGALGTGQNVYNDFLGISAAGSQSYVNYVGAYESLILGGGTVPNNFTFGIYLYDFAGVTLNSGNSYSYDVAFNQDLAPGTFAFATAWYGFVGGQDTPTFYTTPFTRTGFEQQVPEPGTLLLFGTGLLGLGLFRRRMK